METEVDLANLLGRGLTDLSRERVGREAMREGEMGRESGGEVVEGRGLMGLDDREVLSAGVDVERIIEILPVGIDVDVDEDSSTVVLGVEVGVGIE